MADTAVPTPCAVVDLGPNCTSNMDNSALSKMQLHYWEAKQTFLKKVKRKEDDCVVASDAELDAKLELLRSIDETNQSLLNLLDLYQDRVCGLAQDQCFIGRFLRECGKVDATRAGNLMSSSGKTLLFASHQFILLRNVLIRTFRDVQTFQYRAVADTFDTVEQMEKARTTYRAALLWMKDISKQLDPDAYNQLDKFKKVQEHVRKTKSVFEKLKIDSIQKIDLLSASRCNLFSNILVAYQTSLQNIWGKTSKTMDIFVDTFKSHQTYEFTMLKELNVDSGDESVQNFEKRLKEILAQDNINEKDMLIFFEADYKDERGSLQQKEERKRARDKVATNRLGQAKQVSEERESNEIKPTDKKTDSLLDLDFESQAGDNAGHFMPSQLIDFDRQQRMESAELICQSDFEKILSLSIPSGTPECAAQPIQGNTKEDSQQQSNGNTLDSWLRLFSDIDPLSNPDEFDQQLSPNNVDRNC